MLVRREGETLNALLEAARTRPSRLAWSRDVFIDEVNDGLSPLLRLPRHHGDDRTLTTEGAQCYVRKVDERLVFPLMANRMQRMKAS